MTTSSASSKASFTFCSTRRIDFHASVMMAGMRGALLLMGVLVPVAAFAQDYYGAIAYSPSKKAEGWAFNHKTRREAERAALTNCRKFANDCKTQVWFMNACGSLATGPGGYGAAWGSTQAAANEVALKHCQNMSSKNPSQCQVTRQVCTEGRQ